MNDRDDPLTIACAAIDAGVRIVQYRAKRGIVAHELRELVALARRRGVLLMLNDDANAAVQFDCDGVHLGPDDAGFADVARVRTELGDRLIGLSCGTLEETHSAQSLDVDYLGVGPVYATVSKRDAGDPIGIEGLTRIAAASRFPVAAIGGIDALNVSAIARSRVAMAAVISAIAVPDPALGARRLVHVWNETAPR
ncbi:MAG: thiamine phosphate synthase [Candidatus Tumulicola sp.]